MRFLIDSEEFWRSFAQDIRSARKKIYIQTLSFEGDEAGAPIADALTASAAPDRRLLVDAFTKVVQNDRFIYTRFWDAELRAEFVRTDAVIDDMRAAGIAVRFSNPLGFLLQRFHARNHKKIIVVDDAISYIGGLNLTAHNFAWHDLMLRIESPQVAAFLSDDFLASWRGENILRSVQAPGIEIHAADGWANPKVFDRVFELLDSAQQRVFIESPYITPPFFEKLEQVRQRGVEVVLVSPGANNVPPVQHYVAWECARRGIALWHYQGRMSHLKAMLIDDRWLIVGSSNFDTLSYKLYQEIVAIVTDRDAIAEFQTRVVEPDLSQSIQVPHPGNAIGSRIMMTMIQGTVSLSVLMNR